MFTRTGLFTRLFKLFTEYIESAQIQLDYTIHRVYSRWAQGAYETATILFGQTLGVAADEEAGRDEVNWNANAGEEGWDAKKKETIERHAMSSSSAPAFIPLSNPPTRPIVERRDEHSCVFRGRISRGYTRGFINSVWVALRNWAFLYERFLSGTFTREICKVMSVVG